MKGKLKQYNYLVDADEGFLKDCTDTKGPNATIYMFDHAVECYGINEAEYGIHCDNCPGTLRLLSFQCINGFFFINKL